MVLRCFTVHNRKSLNISIVLIIISIMIYIPNFINKIAELTKINLPYFNEIIKSDIYINLIKYSKFLFTIGVIFLILSTLFTNIINKITNYLSNYINRKEIEEKEISEKNNLKIKEKQERAKTTHVVSCPYCGANNILTEKTGKCNYCRRLIK